MECAFCKAAKTLDSDYKVDQESLHDLYEVITNTPKLNSEKTKCENDINILSIASILGSVLNKYPLILDDKKICGQILELLSTHHSYISFQAFISMIPFSNASLKLKLSLKILKLWIKNDHLTRLIVETLNLEDKCYFENLPENYTYFDQLITSLVSLPSRIRNEGYSFFEDRQDYYSVRLYSGLSSGLEEAYKDSKVPVKRFSHFIDRLIQSGYKIQLFSNHALLNILIERCHSCKEWCKLYSNLIFNVHEIHIESVLLQAIVSLSTSEFSCIFLEYIVQEFDKNIHLIFRQLILRDRYIDKTAIEKLTTVCLRSEKLLEFLVETCSNVFQKISDKNYFNNILYEKFVYFSIFLMLTILNISNNDKLTGLTPNFMKMVPSILDLTDARKSMLGRFLIVKLVKVIMPLDKKLKLNYESNEDIKYLENITTGFSKTEINDHEYPDSDIDSDDCDPNIDEKDVEYVDDSIIPFYLRDCLTGLSAQEEDSNKIEACLLGCCRLIPKRPAELCVVSQELCGLLLHHINKYEISNIRKMRLDCLIDLATYDPERSIPYLIDQFFENNCNLSQRFDILNIVQKSSLALSHLTEWPFNYTIPGVEIYRHKEKKGPNLFQKFYHFFIYPLLKDFYKDVPTLQLLNEPFILTEYLKTIEGMILLLQNQSNIFSILTNYLELLKNLQSHHDQLIKKAIIHNLITILEIGQSLDSLEKAELFRSYEDFISWLNELSNFDSDQNIQYTSKKILEYFSQDS